MVVSVARFGRIFILDFFVLAGMKSVENPPLRIFKPLQPIKMRHYITLILLGISTFCSAQIDIKAENKVVNGIILYGFIPDTKFVNYYCSLKTKILIDSMTYDFIPQNDINYSIIRKNRQLEKSLGVADSFLTGNLETNICVYQPNNKRLDKYYCDSLINIYCLNNIYDSMLYKPDLKEPMTLRIKSHAIYSKNQSDTVYIALQFYGTVIQYENIIYGEQTDCRKLIFKNETEEFDDSHSLCPFEKFDSTIIVLNKIKQLDKIDTETKLKLGLIKSELTDLKIFLYE